MASLSDVVDIPSGLNVGLSACPASYLMQKFGVPGELTVKCSPFTGLSKHRIKTASVGSFKVTGMNFAVDSLSAVFAQVKATHPEVYDQVKTAGMLCVRKNKANPSAFSNHSWGCAVDLYFGDGVVPFGTPKAQLGFLYMYNIFHDAGWYWGAGFSGKKDAMHFELSRQAIDSLSGDLAPAGAPMAARTMTASGDLMAASDYIDQMGYDDVDDPA